MKVTLFYADTDYSSNFKDLPAGQTAGFGSGSQADFGVSGTGIAEVHFQIGNDGRRVELRRVGSMPCPVTLNGEETTKAELKDGDVVAAGNTQVKLRIVGLAVSEGGAAAEEAKRCVVSPEPLPTGLIRWACPEEGGDEVNVTLDEALVRLTDNYSPLLMANFMMAGVELPDWLADDAGLLAEMPGGVPAENSLHLIAKEDIPLESIEPAAPDATGPPPQLAALLGLFHKLRSKPAASLLFGDASKDEVLEAIKFHRGFFSTANGLEMFLKQGSPDLAQVLGRASTAILIAGEGDTGWAVYSLADAVETGADLGFDVGPQPDE